MVGFSATNDLQTVESNIDRLVTKIKLFEDKFGDKLDSIYFETDRSPHKLEHDRLMSKFNRLQKIH